MELISTISKGIIVTLLQGQGYFLWRHEVCHFHCFSSRTLYLLNSQVIRCYRTWCHMPMSSRSYFWVITSLGGMQERSKLSVSLCCYCFGRYYVYRWYQRYVSMIRMHIRYVSGNCFIFLKLNFDHMYLLVAGYVRIIMHCWKSRINQYQDCSYAFHTV